ALKVAPPRLDDDGGGGAQRRLERETRDQLAAGRAAGRWRAEAYDQRLAHELSVIAGRELAAHFLAAFEIGRHAREVGIEVMGRGSAVASLVVHLLGLSPVDPVAHGLVFERFLHAGRSSLPDLDLDVPSHRRDELIDWTYRRFGDGRVALASALQTFRRR